jgi:hypothetical protein
LPSSIAAPVKSLTPSRTQQPGDDAADVREGGNPDRAGEARHVQEQGAELVEPGERILDRARDQLVAERWIGQPDGQRHRGAVHARVHIGRRQRLHRRGDGRRHRRGETAERQPAHARVRILEQICDEVVAGQTEARGGERRNRADVCIGMSGRLAERRHRLGGERGILRQGCDERGRARGDRDIGLLDHGLENAPAVARRFDGGGAIVRFFAVEQLQDAFAGDCHRVRPRGSGPR